MEEQINQPTINQKGSGWVWVIFIVAILLIISSGTGVYFWQEKIIAKNNSDHEKALLESQKEKLDLEKELKDSQEQLISLAAANSNDSQLKLPVIQFTPDTFSQDEKNELTEKVINPYVDYEKELQKMNLISIQIEKYTEEEISKQTYARYMYKIDVIMETGHSGWLEREKGKNIDYWIPECMDECSFSESFKAKYPEVIKKYNSLRQK